jgi:hypothetical protein
MTSMYRIQARSILLYHSNLCFAHRLASSSTFLIAARFSIYCGSTIGYVGYFLSYFLTTVTTSRPWAINLSLVRKIVNKTHVCVSIEENKSSQLSAIKTCAISHVLTTYNCMTSKPIWQYGIKPWKCHFRPFSHDLISHFWAIPQTSDLGLPFRNWGLFQETQEINQLT